MRRMSVDRLGCTHLYSASSANINLRMQVESTSSFCIEKSELACFVASNMLNLFNKFWTWKLLQVFEILKLQFFVQFVLAVSLWTSHFVAIKNSQRNWRHRSHRKRHRNAMAGKSHKCQGLGAREIWRDRTGVMKCDADPKKNALS